MEQRSKERNVEIGANADSAIGCCIVQRHGKHGLTSTHQESMVRRICV